MLHPGEPDKKWYGCGDCALLLVWYHITHQSWQLIANLSP